MVAHYRRMLFAFVAFIVLAIVVPTLGNTSSFAATRRGTATSYTLSLDKHIFNQQSCQPDTNTTWQCNAMLSISPVPSGLQITLSPVGSYDIVLGTLTLSDRVTSTSVNIYKLSCSSSAHFTFSGVATNGATVVPDIGAVWSCPAIPPAPTPTNIPTSTATSDPTNTPIPTTTPSAVSTQTVTPTTTTSTAITTTPLVVSTKSSEKGTPSPAQTGSPTATPSLTPSPTSVNNISSSSSPPPSEPPSSSMGDILMGSGFILAVLAFLLYLLPKRQSTLLGRVLSLILPVALLRKFGIM